MQLQPHIAVLKAAEEVIDLGLKRYYNYQHSIEDEDLEEACPDTLSVFLQEISDEENSPFNWSVVPAGCTIPILPYIQSASIAADGKVNVNLWPETFEDEPWDPDIFKFYLMHVMGHECVHVSQFLRMTPGIFVSTPGSFEKAEIKQKKEEDKAKNRNPGHPKIKDLTMKYYLSDSLEIMAHAYDLAHEISMADQPNIALRDPEGFYDFLPTWRKYRKAGFLRKDPVIKRLLKYTALYLN